MPVVEGRRDNGFQSPLHKLQMSTWLIFPVLLIQYFTFLYPLLWDYVVVKVLITLIYLLASAVTVIVGYLCCAIDPADDALKEQHLGSGSCTADSVYCYICEVNVNKCSKHCRYCDKCVARLDHHCKWLNTCIGSKNYVYFFALLVGITVIITISTALSFAYLVNVFAYPNNFDKRIAALDFSANTGNYEAIDSVGVKVILIISVIILLPLTCLIYQLVIFHCMLALKGLTTYEYVTLESKRIRANDAEITAENEETTDERAVLEDTIPQPLTPPIASSTDGLSGHLRSRAMDHNKRRPSIISTFTSDNEIYHQNSKQLIDISLLCGDHLKDKEDSLSLSNLDIKEVGGGIGFEPDNMKNENCESDDVVHDRVDNTLMELELKGVDVESLFLEEDAPTKYYELLKN